MRKAGTTETRLVTDHNQRAIWRTAGIMTTAKRKKVPTGRLNELKRRLEDWRRELVHDVQVKIRDARTDTTLQRHAIDQGESSEADIQNEIEFALIQMKSETLAKIDTAVRQIEEGAYGKCFECGREIAKARLVALPFAVRCKECEEAHEAVAQRDRSMSLDRASTPFFHACN
jgi:DnaK suppressor protein